MHEDEIIKGLKQIRANRAYEDYVTDFPADGENVRFYLKSADIPKFSKKSKYQSEYEKDCGKEFRAKLIVCVLIALFPGSGLLKVVLFSLLSLVLFFKINSLRNKYLEEYNNKFLKGQIENVREEAKSRIRQRFEKIDVNYGLVVNLCECYVATTDKRTLVERIAQEGLLAEIGTVFNFAIKVENQIRLTPEEYQEFLE